MDMLLIMNKINNILGSLKLLSKQLVLDEDTLYDNNEKTVSFLVASSFFNCALFAELRLVRLVPSEPVLDHPPIDPP